MRRETEFQAGRRRRVNVARPLSNGLLTGLASIGSYYIMPMPTVRLKPVRITQTHIWLTGAAPEYLAQLPQR